jgi:hypothetical protein
MPPDERVDAGSAHLDEVGAVVETLAELGFDPILVGGMALVTLGSRRVTRDFDFVIAHPGDGVEGVVRAFYERGFQLAARLNADGDITATIDNAKVAGIRLRLDAPATAYFVNPVSGLRVDLLFDFPVPARKLARRATRITVRSRSFRRASEADLLTLKRIARAARAAPGDAEDIAFLEARRRKRRG